jgi:hypothetical protein
MPIAALNLPWVSVEEYLNTQYPDGDREYLDGVVVERNVGTSLAQRLAADPDCISVRFPEES